MLRKFFASGDRIGFTAHYTAFVSHQHKLDYGAQISFLSRFVYFLLAPISLVFRFLFKIDVDANLVIRHLALDELIEKQISQLGKAYFVELGCGYSGRGVFLAKKYGAERLQCFDLDLPKVISRKRALYKKLRVGSYPNFTMAPLDILAPLGSEYSIENFFRSFPSNRPVIIVTEGLVNYFSFDQISLFWERIAPRFNVPGCCYLTDIFTRQERGPKQWWLQGFTFILSLLVRGRVHLHFSDEDEIKSLFSKLGFAKSTIQGPENFSCNIPRQFLETRPLVRVLQVLS